MILSTSLIEIKKITVIKTRKYKNSFEVVQSISVKMERYGSNYAN